MDQLISHGAPTLPVNDLQRSLTFYTDHLGFEVSFLWEDPATYAILRAGEFTLHLSQRDSPVPEGTEAGRLLYLFVHDVDAMHQRLVDKGARLSGPPERQAYRMRDFEVWDPDGHRITIGRGEE
ncbi:glyoxalase/bleomycin resistance/extradiol dioxygenase family protein [Lewinella sp. W8]|uniref:VOC family protein n=1 Tax=Lewinella sp. W8 TaxID=2528208 RepID=UPI001067554C|nr:VOC family protein [Lewinella sp. W8]MTB49596.1 hypothetical protein [Lewinella sp. W8]